MQPTTEAVLVAVRKIIRASDVHSNQIRRSAGLTSPQLLLLRAIKDYPTESVGKLSERICLSQATVTIILDRLESDGLAVRYRSDLDKRKVHARLTDRGRLALELAPSPLQAHFVEEFENLKPFEQTAMLSALQRVAEMMQAPLPKSDVLDTPLLEQAL